jgi:hypothetical protein
MKFDTSILIIALILSVLVMPVLADTPLPAVPSFSQGWTSLGATAQAKIVTLINIFFAIVVIAAIAYTFIGPFNYFIGGREHNPEQRNAGFHQMGMGIVVVFICLIVYGAIIYLFTA